jgi:hypothetical protein
MSRAEGGRRRHCRGSKEAEVEEGAADEVRDEATTRFEAGDEAAACDKNKDEATACDKNKDEAAVCSEAGIKDGRRRRHNSV